MCLWLRGFKPEAAVAVTGRYSRLVNGGRLVRSDQLVRSGLVLFLELVADLMGDFFLLLALLGQLVIAYNVPDDFLGLTYEDVLPGSRGFGWLVFTVCHDFEARGSTEATVELATRTRPRGRAGPADGVTGGRSGQRFAGIIPALGGG